MNATWITLLVVAILGLTKLLTWWLGKPRKLEALRRREREILEKMRTAAGHSDDIAIARFEHELNLVRQDLAFLTGK